MTQYGQKVSQEEINRILGEESAIEEMKKTILAEISSLKPGECIAYEKPTKTEDFHEDFIASYVLRALLPPKGKFKVIDRKTKTYIYREK